MGLLSSNKTHNTRSSNKPSMFGSSSRAKPATVETHQSRNPITGTTTTTTTTTQKSKPRGAPVHGHGGAGPMASTHRSGHTSHASHRTNGPTTTTHRKPATGGGLMNKLTGKSSTT